MASRTTFSFVSLVVTVMLVPAASAAAEPVVDLTFPVDGHTRFIDDYEQPRSGGRVHKATDVMAPAGRPVHAAVGGTISFITGLDGRPPSYGYMITIRGDDGRDYDYIHLGRQEGRPSDAYAPGMRQGLRVRRGQHIGFVGCSGNAVCSAPHLHFSIEDPTHVDAHGSNYLNPYRSLVAALDRSDLPVPAPVPVAAASTLTGVTPVPPARIVDTRRGLGTDPTPLGRRETRTVQVAGVGGVPAEGVSTVVVNVTATGATTPTYVTLWDTGARRPHSSTLNVVPGETVANLATIPVGPDGRIHLYNFSGEVSLVLDVAGYGTVDGTEHTLVGLPPRRVLDTRAGVGSPSRPLGPGESRRVRVVGVGGVPSSGVRGVLLTVTATRSTRDTYLTVHPSDRPRPTASNVNVAAGRDTPNQALAFVDDAGYVTVYNYGGSTHVVFDVAGYVGSSPARLGTVTPTRALDTREGAGRPIGHGGTRLLDLSGVPSEATAVVVNLTVASATRDTYLTFFPAGGTRPVASNINVIAGGTRAVHALVPLGRDRQVAMFNYAGEADVVVDVLGYVTR